MADVGPDCARNRTKTVRRGDGDGAAAHGSADAHDRIGRRVDDRRAFPMKIRTWSLASGVSAQPTGSVPTLITCVWRSVAVSIIETVPLTMLVT
jgi:hypothetical protein